MKKQNRWLGKIQNHIEEKLGGGKIIPYSATYEYDVTKGNIKPDGKEYPKSLINKIIKSGFKILNLINFYTVGKDEVRAWTVRKGEKAP
jgi:obg-like ATPase 1